MTFSPDINKLPEIDTTISCSNCAGLGALCCRANVVLPLSKKEAAWLEAGGTEIQLFPVSEIPSDVGKPGFRRQYYIFDGDCANLQTDGSCGKYEQRTKACRKFVVGGYYCQLFNKLRQNTAVPKPSNDSV